MASINYATREISCKIVYYGPGLSGKTTNLQIIHRKVPNKEKSEMVSLATETDRTLFFDFLPLDLGSIKGFSTKFQLYTVPGQVYYNATRKLVLRGVDGVVFVADSQSDKLQENLESFANLEENLREYGHSIETIPVVMQYNKRDLPNVMSVEELNSFVNKYRLPYYEAVASTGVGVFTTLKAIGKAVIDRFNAKYAGYQGGRRSQMRPGQARPGAGAPAGPSSSGAVPPMGQPGMPGQGGFPQSPGQGYPSPGQSYRPQQPPMAPPHRGPAPGQGGQFGQVQPGNPFMTNPPVPPGGARPSHFQAPPVQQGGFGRFPPPSPPPGQPSPFAGGPSTPKAAAAGPGQGGFNAPPNNNLPVSPFLESFGGQQGGPRPGPQGGGLPGPSPQPFNADSQGAVPPPNSPFLEPKPGGPQGGFPPPGYQPWQGAPAFPTLERFPGQGQNFGQNGPGTATPARPGPMPPPGAGQPPGPGNFRGAPEPPAGPQSPFLQGPGAGPAPDSPGSGPGPRFPFDQGPDAGPAPAPSGPRPMPFGQVPPFKDNSGIVSSYEDQGPGEYKTRRLPHPSDKKKGLFGGLFGKEDK